MDWTLILATIAGSSGAILSGLKAYSTVKEGERGVLLTFGKAQRDEYGDVVVYEPGGRWIWPWAQKMDTLRVQKNIISYEGLTITLKNNLTYKFNAMLVYDVIEEPKWIEHILYKMEDRDSYVGVYFMQAIQKVLHRSEELDIKNASNRLKKELSIILEANGWRIEDIDVTLFTETPISQFLRGTDYRISKALEYKDQLPDNVLCAALGVNAVVTVEESGGKVKLVTDTE
jgi:regulator of protease activity HflC (stomatin/prohibitin superfamily)